LGEVLAVAEPDKSVEAFVTALDVRRRAYAAGTGAQPSSRLLNNTGVLQYRSKEFSQALVLMQAALEQQRGLILFPDAHPTQVRILATLPDLKQV
jgi:hypothetical protein